MPKAIVQVKGTGVTRVIEQKDVDLEAEKVIHLVHPHGSVEIVDVEGTPHYAVTVGAAQRILSEANEAGE